jgi:hypothetical protein
VNEAKLIQSLWEYLRAEDLRFGAGTFEDYERAKALTYAWFDTRATQHQPVPHMGRTLRLVVIWVGV